MPIVWKAGMSVGNTVIDDEHKHLICLINSVEIALKADDHLTMIRFLVSQLEEFTHNHFREEEGMMLKLQYAGYAEHKQAHQNILENIAALSERLNELSKHKEEVDLNQMELALQPAPTNKAQEFAVTINKDSVQEVEADIVKILRSWVIEHVLVEDMKMKHLFKGHR